MLKASSDSFQIWLTPAEPLASASTNGKVHFSVSCHEWYKLNSFYFRPCCLLAVKRCVRGCLGFLTQVSGLMSPACPGSALRLQGVSFRPVRMAKQESEERGAADELHAHSTHCDDHSRTIALFKKQKRRFRSQRWNAVDLPEACRACPYLVKDEHLLWFMGIFPPLHCCHSYFDGVITF